MKHCGAFQKILENAITETKMRSVPSQTSNCSPKGDPPFTGSWKPTRAHVHTRGHVDDITHARVHAHLVRRRWRQDTGPTGIGAYMLASSAFSCGMDGAQAHGQSCVLRRKWRTVARVSNWLFGKPTSPLYRLLPGYLGQRHRSDCPRTIISPQRSISCCCPVS